MARGEQAHEALTQHAVSRCAQFGATIVLIVALSALTATAQQLVTAGVTSRSYRVGDSTISERVGSARLELFSSRARLRLDASRVNYRSSLGGIDGRLPVAIRLDVSPRAGDTVTVFARTATNPFDLTPAQTSALSLAGTSTLDLESTSLGTPALGGARAAFSLPIGDVVVALRAGAEVEPRPEGAQPVYWRGTTLRGGVALTSSGEQGSIVASLEATRSSGDSLGGRNLFPGGGSVTVQMIADLSAPDPFDPLEDERWPVRAVLFYSRPFSNARADQPNLLIPQGSLVGGLATLLVPIGGLTLSPAVQLLHESSSSGSMSGALTSTISGSAWVMEAGLDLSIPLGSTFELTPQAGFSTGRAGAVLSSSTTARRGRLVRTSGFSDSIHGHYLGLQLSARM